MSVQWKAVAGGLVFVLVGLAVAGGVGYTELQDHRIRDEVREAPAEFLRGTVDQDRERRGDAWRTVYVARSYYEYTVDGTRYEGNTYATYDSPTRADRAVERFEARDPLTVYYHPDSPGDSFTSRPGVELSSVVLGAGVGGVFVLVGLRTIGEGIRGEANAG